MQNNGHILWLLLFAFLISGGSVYSQNNTTDSINTDVQVDTSDFFNKNNLNAQQDSSKKVTKSKVFQNDKVILFFRKDSILLEENEIVSNVLVVYNLSPQTLSFKADIIYPEVWKNISFNDDNYTVNPGDSAFIPISIIPSKGLMGATTVMINGVLLDSLSEQIGSNYFYVYTQKIMSWETSVEPGKRIYFRNGENSKDIEYSILNTGNNRQDFFINLRSIGQNLVVIDSNQSIVKSGKTIILNPYQDSTFKFTVKAIHEGQRNFRRVSNISHRPSTDLVEKNYTLFIESKDPKAVGNSLGKANRVDFVKLPNEVTVSEQGSATFPLTVWATAQNLFGDYSFMNINMQGFKQLNSKASLVYYSQLNYNTVYWNRRLLNGSPWYIGYFDDKISAELGQLSGDIIGIVNYGKGAKASYTYFDNKHKTSAFYIKSPFLFNAPQTESYGMSHMYRINPKINITAGAGRGVYHRSNTTVDAANLKGSFSIAKNHNLSLIFAGTNTTRDSSGTKKVTQGYMAGLNYATSFFDRKMRTNIGARYRDRNFSTGAYERIDLNHMSIYTISDKWNVMLNNFYNKNNIFNIYTDTLMATQEQVNNTLLFTTMTGVGSFQPGLFYNYSDILDNRIHSRGISMRYSTYSFNKNAFASAFFRAGYNDALDFQGINDYFIFQFYSIVRYKVWNFTARYDYGANSLVTLQYMVDYGIAPQTLRLSLQHQHLFKNTHFLLENTSSYNYNNIFKSHTFNYSPEIFYFTNSGWRFSFASNYSYSSNNYASIYANVITTPTSDVQPTAAHNITFRASILKDFNIPVPFVKKKAVDADFIAFYDLNGNGIRENNEPLIENVVISIDKMKEVLTNRKGEAVAKNIPFGSHKVELMALDPIEGWFPNLPDSTDFVKDGDYYLPFVRGVKVYGEVVLDRQRIAVVDEEKKFDLSRIKITATNGKVYSTLTDVDGKFEFYMPNGDYIITIDESILGSRYKLTRNNIPLNLQTEQTNVYVSFYIVEKKRKVEIKDFSGDE